jgi:hypothetical protein
MANVKKDALSPLVHDDQTDHIVGVKNSDGSEKAFVYTDGSQAMTGNLIFGTSDNGVTASGAFDIVFRTSGSTERVRFGNSGNVSISNGNLILGTSGNGISFAATSDPTIPAVAATGTITRTATNVSDGDTVTLGAQVYTFKTTLTPADYEVLIGADAAASLTNLANAINGTGGTPGTDYQVPAANASASAGTIVGSVLPLTALTAGTAGNSIALAETSAQLSVSGAAFTGGVNARGATGEVLDDYETGLWTPGLTSATVGDLFVRYTQRRGAYVKIGRSVTVHGVLACVPTYSTASGQLRLTGLPYASATGTDVPNEWPGFVSYMQNVTATNWVNAGIAAVQGQTYSLITGSVSASSVVVSSITDIASGSTFFISYTVTYLVP